MASDFEFRIGADLTEIKAALSQLRGEFTKVSQSTKTSGAGAFPGLQGQLGGLIKQAVALAAAFASVQTAIQLIKTADELNTLNARLRIATRSTEEFARAQLALFELSQRSRASLTDTIELYSKIAVSVKDAGVGQEVLLSIVETINQAVALSGSSAAASQAALVQLGQGLASGTLRGEELNSILEQTPVLADAIAQGLGKTRGELRKLGEEGKLTAEQVIKALLAQKDVIAQQFASLPLTVGQSLTLLKNSGLQLLGLFDQVTGTTGGLAKVIGDFAAFLSSDSVQGAIIEFGILAEQYFTLAVDTIKGAAQAFVVALELITGALDFVIGALSDFIRFFTLGLLELPRSTNEILALVVRAFRELPNNIRASIQILTVTILSNFDKIVAGAQGVKEALIAIAEGEGLKGVLAAVERYNQRITAIEQAARETIDAALADREAANNAAAEGRRLFEEEQKRRRGIRTGTGLGKFKPAPPKNATDAGDRADAEIKLLKDSIDRAQREIDKLYEDSLVTVRTYYSERARIETLGIDAQIELEKKKAAAAGPGTKDALKAQTEITLLERRRVDVSIQAEREIFKAKRDLDRELALLRAQELENEGNAAAAASIRLQAQYRDLIMKFQAEGNAAGVKIIEGLINTGVARAQFDQLKNEFDRITQELQNRTQSLADQQRTGAIPNDTAQQQTTDARATAIAQLSVLNAKLQELAKNTNDPTIISGAANVANALRNLAIDGATGLDKAVINLRASLANLQQGFADTAVGSGVDALATLFTDLAGNTKSAGDAIKDFARSFAASMAQIAARALATYAVLQILEAVFPGAGRLVAGAGGVTAGVRHSGGMVGGGPKRTVNPLLFAAAPRYHSGGMVGLAPDERPAILQTGEEVLSRADPRNRANGGGQAVGGTRIINVIDPALVQDYMASSAGERTILNVIERNAGSVRQKLA